MGSFESRKENVGHNKPIIDSDKVDPTADLTGASGPKSYRRTNPVIDIQVVSAKPAISQGFLKSVISSNWSKDELINSTIRVAVSTGVLLLLSGSRPEIVQPTTGVFLGIYLSSILFSNNEIAERFKQFTKSSSARAAIIATTVLTPLILEGIYQGRFVPLLCGFVINPTLRLLFHRERR